MRKKIFFSMEASKADLAVAVCRDNTYLEVLDFIREIDAQQQDSVFTDLLYDLASTLKREQDNA